MTGPTLTRDQAVARIEQLITATAQVITPEPRLEEVPSFSAPSGCQGDGTAEDQIIVSRAYWLRGIPEGENMRVSAQIRSYWESQGYRIVAAGSGDGNPGLSGESQPERFRLSLVWAEGDDLYLGASSTCIWPDGTPAAHRPPRSNR
ncbi:hypothetical protein ACIBG7_25235 [Nonomuraea sp. NPDC050328]|uniref:hypothetical protein n=1 Tax=Nonomuraea sp. NPDC050328 TaxID=3364361 RepID=UPI003790676B